MQMQAPLYMCGSDVSIRHVELLYVTDDCTVDSDVANGVAAIEKSLPSVRSAPSLRQVTPSSASDAANSSSR